MSGSDQPLVSVGLPTYNRAAHLERAIDSVFTQGYRNIELVISDNASTDGTEALCRRAAARDGRVRYLKQQANQGAAANFRHVLAQSRGDLFMWLADDDWLEPTYIERCVAVLASSPEHSIVSGRDRYHRDGVVDHEGTKVTLEETSGPERVVSYYRQVGLNGAFYGVMRRDLISRVPFVNRLGGDWLVVAAMAFMGKLRTLDDTHINRSRGGLSVDWASLAKAFDLTKVEEENPILTIATSVFSDIGWHSAIYASLGPAQRLALAARASYTIVRRHHSRRQAISVVRRLYRVVNARRP